MSQERVLVVGVRSEHAHKLKELLPKCDLSFITDHKQHKPISNSDSYDRIFMLTKFTNHCMHKKFRSHSGYTMVSGGFSTLRKELENRYA